MIHILLSIYLIILSCMPCADTKEDVHEYSFLEVENTKHEEHSHDQHNDLCSPFCTCNCCSSQILVYSDIQSLFFPLQFEEIKMISSFYKTIFTSNFYGSIWQPPQIA
jgi:hypothetical protein